jgi:uncharacterized iron-regulated protein
MRKVFLLLPCLAASCASQPPPCPSVGQWLAPATLGAIADPVPRAATTGVILLGEEHDNAADHAWQLATIRRLYAADPRLVLGFEMFPRGAQKALDRWTDGTTSEAAFLSEAGWKAYWGFDPALYLPIFRFARDHHLPMLALNVSHHLVHAVAQTGWDAVKPADREGVGTPAPPAPSYRATLAEAMSGHGGPAMTPARLSHFIEAQSVWDRAMAEAIAAQRKRDPTRPVVAIMGAGHLEHRDGVPHQLAALGIANTAVLLPSHGACARPAPGLADAIYTD